MELTPLRRAPSGGVLGGVCAGLARRWQIDPTVVRIGMVLLALLSGLGVAFYVGALLLVPKDGSADLPIHRLLPVTRSWSPTATIGSVVGVGLVITVALGSWLPFGILPLIGLAFLWYFGVHRGRRPSHHPATTHPDRPSLAADSPARTAVPTTEFERAAAAWQARVADERQLAARRPRAAVPPARPDLTPAALRSAQPPGLTFTPQLSAVQPSVQSPPSVPPPVPNWTPPTVARRRGPRWLWPLVLCLAGAGLTVLGLVSRTGTDVPAVAYPAVVLGALGVGLVIGAFCGRPRRILPLAIVAGVVTAGLMLPVPHAENVGDRTYVYTSTATLPSVPLRHGAGDIVVDASGLPITESRTIEFSNGAGDMAVRLPVTGNVVVHWSTGLGDYQGPDGSHDGAGIKDTFTRLTDPNGPTLEVNVRTGLGDIRVIAP